MSLLVILQSISLGFSLSEGMVRGGTLVAQGGRVDELSEIEVRNR